MIPEQDGVQKGSTRSPLEAGPTHQQQHAVASRLTCGGMSPLRGDAEENGNSMLLKLFLADVSCLASLRDVVFSRV
jgi:hypothetical protein